MSPVLTTTIYIKFALVELLVYFGFDALESKLDKNLGLVRAYLKPWVKSDLHLFFIFVV